MRRMLGASLVLIAAACNEGLTGPDIGPPAPPDVRAHVVGAALTSLDASGHFRLSEPSLDSPYPTISAERATELAAAVIRTWFLNPPVFTFGDQGLAESVELLHGAAIQWDRVKPGSRPPYFSQSHLQPLPDGVRASSIRQFGPQYLIPMYVSDQPTLVVAISVHATNAIINEEGLVEYEGLSSGGEFAITGVPITLGGVTVPPSPEIAVQFAAQSTGVRISEVPILGAPGNRTVTTAARWQLRLEQPVEFTRLIDGATLTTDEVFVGLFPGAGDARIDPEWDSGPFFRLRLFAASPTQPREERYSSELSLPLKEGYAADLNEIVLSGTPGAT